MRLKFKVNNAHPELHGTRPAWTLTLDPVYDGSPENAAAFDGVPAGIFQIVNLIDPLAGQIAVGDEVFVDITRAEPR